MTSDSAITGPATDPTRHNHAGLRQRETAHEHLRAGDDRSLSGRPPTGWPRFRSVPSRLAAMLRRRAARIPATTALSHVTSHPRGAAASSAHSATGARSCAVISLPRRPGHDPVGPDAHRCAVLARFVEARDHIDLVIAQLLIEDPGTPIGLLRAQTPTQRRSTRHSVSGSIADAIEAFDLAFEAWLDGTATEPIREPRT